MPEKRTRSSRLGGLTRREALKAGAAAFGAVALSGCGSYAGGALDLEVEDADLEAVAGDGRRPDLDIAESGAFPLGVASGVALSGGRLVWARYWGGSALRLSVWRRGDDEEEATLQVEPPTAFDGSFLRATLPPLTPGAEYEYAFFELDEAGEVAARSPIGRLRAALPDSALEPVTLGATGCTEFGVPFDVVEAAADEPELDGFVLLGDTVYADKAVGLHGLRGLWHDTLGTTAYRALRARCPVMAIWDDHEVDNNFDPEQIDPGRLEHATRAFYEHQPLERVPDEPTRLWRKHRFGRTVEVFLLDCRAERRPSTRGHEDELLSPRQLAWLKEGLAESDAVFKVIVTGIPIGDVPVPWAEDRWPGYVGQREELLRFIEEEPIDGALFLAGDIHMAWVGAASTLGPGSRTFEVGAGCGAKEITNPLAYLFAPPRYDFAAAVNNYATLRFDPQSREVEIVHKTAAGELNRMWIKP